RPNTAIELIGPKKLHDPAQTNICALHIDHVRDWLVASFGPLVDSEVKGRRANVLLHTISRITRPVGSPAEYSPAQSTSSSQDALPLGRSGVQPAALLQVLQQYE